MISHIVLSVERYFPRVHILKSSCAKNKKKKDLYAPGKTSQLGPMLSSHEEELHRVGASQESNFFLLTPMLLVMLDFLLQGRQSTDTKTAIWYDYILPSPCSPPPIDLMKDSEVQFVVDK